MSDGRWPICDVRYAMSDMRYPICDIRYPIGALFLLFGVFEWKVPVVPVLEGPVVQQDVVAERARRKQHRGRLLADVAVADDRVAGFDAGLVEDRVDLGGRLELTVVDRELVERRVHRARNVAEFLRLSALPAASRPVEELGVARVDDR